MLSLFAAAARYTCIATHRPRVQLRASGRCAEASIPFTDTPLELPEMVLHIPQYPKIPRQIGGILFQLEYFGTRKEQVAHRK